MKYEQATGTLYDTDGKVIGMGWAGHLRGKNNPSLEGLRDVGPLPKGLYTIQNPIDSPQLGPLAFPLIPDPKNEMFGRSGFYIHGASIENPVMSSNGCIIQIRTVREYIRQKIRGTAKDAPQRILEVV